MKTITLDVPESLVPLIDSLGSQLTLVLEMGMSRFAPLSTKAYMETVEFLTGSPSAQQVAGFAFSDDVEARIAELLQKNSEGTLSKAEDVELERLSRLEEQLQLLKARALTGSG